MWATKQRIFMFRREITFLVNCLFTVLFNFTSSFPDIQFLQSIIIVKICWLQNVNLSKCFLGFWKKLRTSPYLYFDHVKPCFFYLRVFKLSRDRAALKCHYVIYRTILYISWVSKAIFTLKPHNSRLSVANQIFLKLLPVLICFTSAI